MLVAGGRAREVLVARLQTIDDLLPGRWYGFDAVDVVVVDTNDKEMLATLSGNRGEALKQWVQRGGHLVVAVSSNWQAVNDGLLGEMLPARLNGQIQVTPFDSLESFTGGSHQVAFENVADAGREAGGHRGPRGQGDRLDPLDPAGRPGALRVRPGDLDRPRRRHQAVRRLARSRPCSSSRRST